MMYITIFCQMQTFADRNFSSHIHLLGKTHKYAKNKSVRAILQSRLVSNVLLNLFLWCEQTFLFASVGSAHYSAVQSEARALPQLN